MTKTNKSSAVILISLLLLPGLQSGFAAPENSALNWINTAAPAAIAPVPAPRPSASRISSSDVTAEYLAAFTQAAAALDPAVVEKLKAYKVLLIPGLFSNMDKSRLKGIGVFFSPKPKPRFEDQIALLKELGVKHERLEMTSESSIQDNAALVSAAIKRSDKPVIIFASSKAGLDTLEAFITDKKLLSRVRGMITLQSPFLGTPVVDYMMSKGAIDRNLSKALLQMGGSRDSLLNCSEADRKIYNRENAAAIAQTAATVPIISVTTWIDPAGRGKDTSLKLLRNRMLKNGIINDGLVPLDSGIMPGTDYIKIPGVDHGAIVKPHKNISLDRVRFTKALLLMILAR